MKKARWRIGLKEIIEEDSLFAAEFKDVPAAHPGQRRTVGIESVRKAGIRAALAEQRGGVVIHLNDRHSSETIYLAEDGVPRGGEYRVELRIVFRYRGDGAVNGEAIGPHQVCRRGPVVFQNRVVHVGDAVETVADVAVAQNCGHTIGAVKLAIAGGKVVLVVEVMIDLDVELPAVCSAEDDLVKILGAGRGVIDRRHWIEIDDFLSDRVNEIGVDQIGHREGLAIAVDDIERVENLLLHRLADSAKLGCVGAENEGIAEIAGALAFGGHEGVNFHGVLHAKLFKINEEKCFLLSDWPAERETVLIAQMVRSGSALRVVEEIVGVERGTLSKPPAAAVKFIAALLQYDVDDGAAVVAELRGEAVVLHFELLNDLDGGLIVDVGCGAFALFRSAGQCSVNTDFSGGIALTVGNEICAGRIRV